MSLPDSFTGANGTALTAYDPLYVSNAAHTGVLEIQNNKVVVRASPATPAEILWDQSPVSADYDVSADYQHSSAFGSICGVCGRADKIANTAYQYRINGSDVQLYKFVAGAATQLGSNVAAGYTLNTPAAMLLRMVGTAITCFFVGVQKLSVTDGTISAKGYGGMRFSAGSGGTLDNFNVTNLGAGNPIASLSLTTEAAAFSGGASVSPVAGMAVTTADAAFTGSASAPPVATLAATTQGAAFSGSASVSPLAALAVTTEDTAFAGSASAPPLAGLDVTAQGAVFAGEASSFSGPSVSLAVTTQDAVFAGSASAPPIAGLDVTAQDAVFAGSATGATSPEVSLAVTTQDATFSGLASVSPLTVLAITSQDAVFAGSALGLLGSATEGRIQGSIALLAQISATITPKTNIIAGAY